MFTGLVQTLGRILNTSSNDSGKEFEFYCPELTGDIQIDASVAVNGVCLTVTALTEAGFRAQAVHVTLEKTNLGQLQADDKINLELSMRYSDRVGGHFVQGHVNGLVTLIKNHSRAENYELWFRVPQEFRRFILKEGSVALDGISLTVADVQDDKFMVSIIPHTWKQTQIYTRRVGDLVNLEVDMMAKMMATYVDSYMQNNRGAYAGI